MKVKRVRFPESKRIEQERKQLRQRLFRSCPSGRKKKKKKASSIVHLRKKWKILFEPT